MTTTILSDPRPVTLTAGSLSLDMGARVLIGPGGSTKLDPGTFAFLAALMRKPWQTVRYEDLIAGAWSNPDAEPENASGALRSRAQRARDAIHKVGAASGCLQVVHQVGYLLEGSPRVVRTFTPAQAAALDAWSATHPAFQPEQVAA